MIFPFGFLESLGKIKKYSYLCTIKNIENMVRIRLNRGMNGNILIQDFGFIQVIDNNRTWYTKKIGSYGIQIKPDFPSNVRIKDWDDNRTPWILFKFLLLHEAGMDINGKIKIEDSGKYKILNTQDTLSLIRELSEYTDIKKRLKYWYNQFLSGKLKLII